MHGGITERDPTRRDREGRGVRDTRVDLEKV